MKPMTQAELSQATSNAARWFDHHRNRYTAEDEDLFDALLHLVETRLHLLALSEELERRPLHEPMAQDRTANPSPHHTPVHSPASITIPTN